MGKNNKTFRLCIYCGRSARTRDHVPPKCLLNQPYPNNLMTVPCCENCNNHFSKDEEYLLYLLTTIGDSPTLWEKQMPDGTIDRAVARNSSLYDRIIEKLEVDDGNRVYLTPEHDRINRIAIKIALGIYYKKYKQVRPVSDFTCLGTFHGTNQIPATIVLMTHTERFIPKKWTTVQRDVFSFIVVRNWQNNGLLLLINLYNTLWSCIEMKPPLRGNGRNKTLLSFQPTLFTDYD